jgi:hypothetical protein
MSAWPMDGFRFAAMGRSLTKFTGAASIRTPLLVGGTLVVCLGVVALIVYMNGRAMATVGLAGAAIMLMAVLYRFEWGFYSFIGAVLVLDQFDVIGMDTLTSRVQYFTNMNANPYITLPAFLVVTPMEVHLFSLLVVWILVYIVQGKVKFQPVPLWGVLGLFFAWLTYGLVVGLRSGGDFTVALWELRALFYCVIFYVLVPQFITTTEQVRQLLWVCIGALSLKAFMGLYRFASLGFSMSGYDELLTSEEPLLIATLLLFLLALVLFNVRTRQKTVLLMLALPLILGFYSGNRRAAYAAFAAALVAFIMLIPRKEVFRFWMYAVPVMVLFVGYVMLFWDSDTRLGSPLRQIRSGFDDEEISERNYYSNLYRKIEEYNLAVTVQHEPVEGIGFGTKYEQPIALIRIDYALQDYMAHNNVLWLLVKTGAVGFFLFWFFLNGFAVRVAGIIGRLHDPYLKAVGVLIIVAVINQMVGAYFDLHLVRYRTMIYLGMLMGLLPVLVRADAASQPKDAARAF